jgi:hypothetical protein
LRQFPGGPPERPYDAAGWTLPLQMGVNVVPAKTPLTAEARAALQMLAPIPKPRITPTPYPDNKGDAAPFDSVPGIGFDTDPAAAAIVPPAGRITGDGPALSIDAAQNNAFRAINRAWTLDGAVQFADGHYQISGLSPEQQSDLVKTLALNAERVAATGATVRRPKVGLFQPWSGSMDEGWTRWLIEQYGFDYVLLHPEDLKASLTGKVDVVLFADDARIPMEGAGRGGRGGAAGGQGRGGRTVRPEYATTLTAPDVQALEQFVRSGGTFIFVNNAATFAIQQFKLPVRNVVAGLKPEEFFLRGTIVDVLPDTSQQQMAGLGEHTPVFADSSPVFETEEGFTGKVLAKYADSGSPLLSGYLIGEQYMNGKAAALDVQLDAGHVILLGFRPEWRDQSFGTFKVIFNSLLASTTGK